MALSIYVALAEHPGIGKVTAYEMLRLLEERGLVVSEYHLSTAILLSLQELRDSVEVSGLG